MKDRFKRIFSGLGALVLVIMVLVGCSAGETKITYGYDENGNYCKFTTCSCCEISEKEIIVNGVTETNATIVSQNVEISYKGDSTEVDTALTYGADFNSVVNALNQRATGTNTKALQTSFDGTTATLGLPISGDIKLTEDITIGYNGNTTFRFFVVGSVTIDLNGYTITQQCGTDGFSGYALFVVRDGGTLNVIDSSEDKEGCINGVVSAVQVNTGGVANLYDGTIVCSSEMTETDASEDYFCIYTVATYGGIFNQRGGVVKTVDTRAVKNSDTPCTLSDYNYAYATYDSVDSQNVTSQINIYGGEIIGEVDPTFSQLNILKNYK